MSSDTSLSSEHALTKLSSELRDELIEFAVFRSQPSSLALRNMLVRTQTNDAQPQDGSQAANDAVGRLEWAIRGHGAHALCHPQSMTRAATRDDINPLMHIINMHQRVYIVTNIRESRPAAAEVGPTLETPSETTGPDILPDCG